MRPQPSGPGVRCARYLPLPRLSEPPRRRATERLLEARLREYSVWAGALSASPLGPRLCAGSTFEPDPLGWDTSTNQSTFPLVSTCATRSVPKDATYMKLPLGSKATPAG